LTEPGLNDPALRDRAVRAATGAAPFDVLIIGGNVADMATGELRPADIGLVGPLIASVHPPGSRSDAGQIIAVAGIVAPGLIDTHLHIESSMVTPRRYAETVLAQGTTTICWDPHELGNVLGLEGVEWAIRAVQDLPLRVLVFAPSCVPSAPGLERGGAVFDPAEMRAMLAMPGIAGVAEVMDMRGVLERAPKMRGIVDAGLASGKLVCGHARGLRGPALQGFAAAGLQSDHEVSDGDELLEKLRAGFTIELRGSHDQVLPGAVAALATLPCLPPTLTICTDDVFPDDLAAKGGVIDVLRRLVRYGMPAMDALRCATLHAALRIGRRDLGLVAPGRRADLIVLSDLQAMRVDLVFASGRVVSQDGQTTVALPHAPPPPRGTMQVPHFAAADFAIAAQGSTARLRTVDRPRFTRWGETAAGITDGAVVLPDDAIYMAVVHRHGLAPAIPVMGVLREWGHWRGAIATTVAHDSHNLVVFGRDAADLAAAANAVTEAGGGMAVASGGIVRAVLPLPICGLISDASTAELATQLAILRQAADAVVPWDPPMLTFKSLVGASLACNPGPHVTDMGITDGSTGEVYASALIDG
jgi:adenine deaminase